MYGNLQFFPYGEHSLHTVPNHFRDTETDFHVDSMLPKQPNSTDCLLKSAGIMAESLIVFLICAIKGNVDPSGRMLAKENCPFLIYQGSIGIDRQDEAHSPQFQIHSLKIREQQRLSSCQ